MFLQEALGIYRAAENIPVALGRVEIVGRFVGDSPITGGRHKQTHFIKRRTSEKPRAAAMIDRSKSVFAPADPARASAA
jgi:hypothetical protein